MEPIVLSRQRTKLGLSTKEMANMVGVTCTTIYGWENGINNILPFYRPKVAESYQISIDDLEIFCNAFSQHRKNMSHIIKSLKKIPKRASAIVEVDSADIGDALYDAIGRREVDFEVHVARRGMDNQSHMGDVVYKKTFRF